MGRQIHRQRVLVGAPPRRLHLVDAPVLRVEATRLGVGAQAQHAVDFWYEHDDDPPEIGRMFFVVGTGHDLPPGAQHRGTTARTPEGLVWHLYELIDSKEG